MKGNATTKPKAKTLKTKKAGGPKKPKSGYIFFTQERRSSLKTERSDLSLTDASKVMGAEWKALSDGEKRRFNDLAAEDRARYNREKGASSSD
jgi:structure-specific recognition protein 1